MKSENREMIQRALGIIEGLYNSLTDSEIKTLMGAVELIDLALTHDSEEKLYAVD